MTRTTRTLALLLGLGLIATACPGVRSIPEIRYYVLALPNGDTSALPAPIRVADFSIDDPYATRQLAYRTSAYRLAYYNYHRWAGSPALVVAAATRDYLKSHHADVADAPFEVGARIRRLEEVDDDDDDWSAALAIEFTVHREGALVLERSFSEVEPVTHRNPEAVVAALSRALQRILSTLVDELAALDTAAP